MTNDQHGGRPCLCIKFPGSFLFFPAPLLEILSPVAPWKLLAPTDWPALCGWRKPNPFGVKARSRHYSELQALLISATLAHALCWGPAITFGA